jgi:hypothetical protein
MSEQVRERGDGVSLPVDLVSQEGTQIEQDARTLLLALQAVAASRASAAREVEKHVIRLNFALERVTELRRQAEEVGGVFAPARAEVAVSILEGHVAVTAGFINRVMRHARRTAGRRDLRVTVDESVALVEEESSADEAKVA